MQLMTTREYAEYRRCSERTAERERSTGRGPAYVRIGGRIYYRREDVDTYIAAHLRGGERPALVARP